MEDLLVLAYLLSPPLSQLPEAGSHHRKTRILFGLRMTDDGDEEHLQCFSEILMCKRRQLSTPYTESFRSNGLMTINMTQSIRLAIPEGIRTTHSGPSTLKMTCCAILIATVAVRYYLLSSRTCCESS